MICCSALLSHVFPFSVFRLGLLASPSTLSLVPTVGPLAGCDTHWTYQSLPKRSERPPPVFSDEIIIPSAIGYTTHRRRLIPLRAR